MKFILHTQCGCIVVKTRVLKEQGRKALLVLIVLSHFILEFFLFKSCVLHFLPSPHSKTRIAGPTDLNLLFDSPQVWIRIFQFKTKLAVLSLWFPVT